MFFLFKREAIFIFESFISVFWVSSLCISCGEGTHAAETRIFVEIFFWIFEYCGSISFVPVVNYYTELFGLWLFDYLIQLMSFSGNF